MARFLVVTGLLACTKSHNSFPFFYTLVYELLFAKNTVRRSGGDTARSKMPLLLLLPFSSLQMLYFRILRVNILPLSSIGTSLLQIYGFSSPLRRHVNFIQLNTEK
jgi:hypothetical protein